MKKVRDTVRSDEEPKTFLFPLWHVPSAGTMRSAVIR
jgi:hypothetical protein